MIVVKKMRERVLESFFLPAMASINYSGPVLLVGLEEDLLLDIMSLFFSLDSLLGADLSPTKIKFSSHSFF